MSDYLNKEDEAKYVKEKEVHVFQQELKCPKCENGTMVFDGCTFTSNPAWYGHGCKTCGHSLRTRSKFPRTVYRS
jgi:ribosomal protein S27E